MQNEMNAAKAKKGNKRRIILIALLVCFAAVIATGTMAYFTVEETSYNVITTGSISIALHETTTDGEPWPEDGVTGVVPGMSVGKVVTVENDGGIDAHVRIALTGTVTGKDGEPLPYEHITLNINTEYWTEQDGFYYYNRALLPGETTEPLFTKVLFEPKMGNDYMDATAKIGVKVYAVQSRNNGETPLEAAGWPAIIDEEEATPAEPEAQ